MATSETHRTVVDDAAIPASWRRVDGFEISRALIDARRPHLLARFTLGDMHEVARAAGYSLPTRAQVYRARETATHVLEPIALPTLELARRYGVPWNGAAIQALREREMRSLAWSEYHDETLTARVEKAGPGSVFGEGKHGIKRADGRVGDLAGWYTEHLEAYTPDRKGAGYVQQGEGPNPPHDGEHHDYASTVILVRPYRPSWFDRLAAEADEVLARVFRGVRGESLGSRALAWSLTFEGLSEIPGPQHHPEILTWGALCRRGGVYLGRGGDGAPVWSGSAAPVGAATDEEAWCAKFASAALHGALRADDAPPHGLRVSVAELVSDARALGSLRMPGYAPRIGDLMILPRAGANPLTGGTGHVARVATLDPLVTIGGNESPGPGQVHRTPRKYADAVAWIAYP